MIMQKMLRIKFNPNLPSDKRTRVMMMLAVLLQVHIPPNIEIVPLYQLPLSREEQPLEQILISRIPRGEHKVGVAYDYT